MIIILNFEFAAAHFYQNSKWTPLKNRNVFGKCYTPHGHGHNYKLELEVDIGKQAPDKAKKTIREHVLPVIDRVDHRHLNFDIPYFNSLIPTTENISLYLKDQIELPAPYHVKLLRLFEMDSIFVELNI